MSVFSLDPIVQRQDAAKYGGKFRAKDLVLVYFNAYSAGNMNATVKG